ncbi:MAG: hypothetical protein WCI72_06245 [archaeon]
MDNNSLTPEGIYTESIKIRAIWRAIYTFFGVIFLSFLMNYMNMIQFSPIVIIEIILIAIVLPIGTGLYEYYFNTNFYWGKTMIDGKQREIKQVLWISGILFLLGLIMILMDNKDKARWIWLVLSALLSFLVFYWRLQNKTKKEGKDTTPILTNFEKWFLLFAAIFILVIILVSYLAIKYYWGQ